MYVNGKPYEDASTIKKESSSGYFKLNRRTVIFYALINIIAIITLNVSLVHYYTENRNLYTTVNQFSTYISEIEESNDELQAEIRNYEKELSHNKEQIELLKSKLDEAGIVYNDPIMAPYIEPNDDASSGTDTNYSTKDPNSPEYYAYNKAPNYDKDQNDIKDPKDKDPDSTMVIPYSY